MFGRNKLIKVVLFLLALVVLVGGAFFILLRPNALLASLPTTTTASFGHSGDPINVALIGDKDSITKTFLAAGWLTPDPITASSTAKIIGASITNSAYPAAPVSNLYLFGRTQDMAFEFPTNTVRERHHVRLWQTTDSVSGKPLWIGSASYDSGIELSGTTALPTHHVSPNVDGERDFLVKSLESTSLVQNELSERNSYPTLWGFNGGGDWYFDDGLVSMLVLK